MHAIQEVIGIITVIMAVGTYLPYLRDVVKQKVKPHPFTWMIWVTLTGIAYIAQIYDGAGPGAWMNGFVLFLGVCIILFSLKNGFEDIRKLDYVVLAIAIVAIILWITTDDPTYSVILVSFANTIAYIPTFRRSYYKPQDEAIYLYGINFFRHGLSMVALANFSLITALFPAVLTINNFALAAFLMWRRKQIK